MLHQFCRLWRPMVIVISTLLVAALAIIGLNGSKVQPRTGSDQSGVGVVANTDGIDAVATGIKQEYERILNQVRLDRNEAVCEAALQSMRGRYDRLAHTAPQNLLDAGVPYAADQLTDLRADWTCHMAVKAEGAFEFGAKSTAVEGVENLGFTAHIRASYGQTAACLTALAEYADALDKLTVQDRIVTFNNLYLPSPEVIADDQSSASLCSPYNTPKGDVTPDRMSV